MSTQANAESCNKFTGSLTSVDVSCVCMVQGCRRGASLCQLLGLTSWYSTGTERWQALLLYTSFPWHSREAVAISCCVLMDTCAIWCIYCRQLEKFSSFSSGLQKRERNWNGLHGIRLPFL